MVDAPHGRPPRHRKDTVHRIWRARGIRPHLVERSKVSNDPDFEAKLVDVVGRSHYLNGTTARSMSAGSRSRRSGSRWSFSAWRTPPTTSSSRCGAADLARQAGSHLPAKVTLDHRCRRRKSGACQGNFLRLLDTRATIHVNAPASSPSSQPPMGVGAQSE